MSENASIAIVSATVPVQELALLCDGTGLSDIAGISLHAYSSFGENPSLPHDERGERLHRDHDLVIAIDAASYRALVGIKVLNTSNILSPICWSGVVGVAAEEALAWFKSPDERGARHMIRALHVAASDLRPTRK